MAAAASTVATAAEAGAPAIEQRLSNSCISFYLAVLHATRPCALWLWGSHVYSPELGIGLRWGVPVFAYLIFI